MNCNIVRDLIPLYIDGCCSIESRKLVEDHIKECRQCRLMLEEMNAPADVVSVSPVPAVFHKIKEWKASVLQSILLFFSFALITLGVALEARTPSGLLNGFWASNLVIPATGFMLSLANWYFIKIYKTRNIFSNCSLLTTLAITLSAYIWAVLHYEVDFVDLFAGRGFLEISHILRSSFYLNGIGISLTIVFCSLSKILSNQYAKMLGKE